MEACLYDPDHGFYASGVGVAGRRGDFITSVEVGPLFGAVVAEWLDAQWARLGYPSPFVVADVGAGPGTWARAIRAATPRCAAALDLVSIELSETARAVHDAANGRSLTSLDELLWAHVIMANELLDNLPVRIIEWHEQGWQEIVVGPDAGARCERLRPAADLPPVVEALGGELLRQDVRGRRIRVPLCDRAARWVGAARARLQAEGRLLVFDYGAATAELADRDVTTWLRTFRQHEPGSSPLEDPGLQDITCDVPFDQLPVPIERVRQGEWLRRWGIEHRVEEGRRIWAERAALGDLTALRARSRVREAEALLDADGLGGFWVLEWGPDGTATPARVS